MLQLRLNQWVMKHFYVFRIRLLVIFFLVGFLGYGQIGIGTTTPNGMLDIESSTQGFVLPRVALTKTDLAAPVVNPAGGALAIGTVVYNTNTTTTGTNDVVPGIYMWDGVDWINEFPKKHAQIFQQSSYIRTISSAGYQNITGLVGQTFTPIYTGTYKIEVSVNYGGGHVLNLISGRTNPLVQQGNFNFNFNGTNNIFPLKSYSVYGFTQYYLIWEQATIVFYEQLTAGTPYNFSLQFDQAPSPGFVDNGNSGNGRGYIGYDIPCAIEFLYMD
jgi:hypothetical protein